MPVLPVETAHFPEYLFDEPTVEASGRRWWVLHTRPRQEKCLARQLHQNQTPFYLPLVARRSILRGRVVTSHNPLFTGYVFVLAHERERIAALTTGRVVHALPVTDQEQLADDLSQLHRLIASGAPVTPEERLTPGMAVEIRSGPLAGLHGTVLRTATGRRFVVQVNFIQRGASVELDDFMLAPTG
jgi:transcription antitermination factor NusG